MPQVGEPVDMPRVPTPVAPMSIAEAIPPETEDDKGSTAEPGVMMRQAELIERVRAYHPGADEDAISRAYEFAMLAHGSQTRASGDPYFSHPLEVAGILTQYCLDSASIVTALLHDTLEDTAATEKEIEDRFGAEIAQLVDGVTKLSRLEWQSDKAQQAENFRKLVLATSRDIRVLLVKLADRLHNMRTLRHIPDPEKRRRIARETMDIYAPLAQRIGMQALKDELEDTAFAELNPDARDSIMRRLEFLRARGGDLIGRILDELRQVVAEAQVEAEIAGREKAPYSVWRKMHNKSVGFEQLSDIMAFRIIVDSVADCYAALGVIHGRYPVVPGRFKDFISMPKRNGYRSLHTAVLGPEGQRIEVQIRTQDMQDEAERGVAAHWQYKQGDVAPSDGRRYRWLQELLEILESAAGPEEFLEHTKLEMFHDQVFCFSPKGEVYALPRGATTIDFAYAVHSEVGDHCVGGKVNGRLMPLHTALTNGDQVEILTSRRQKPSPEWEHIVITGKARSRIRRYVRQEQRRQYQSLGHKILEKAFRKEGHDCGEKALKPVLGDFQCSAVEDLYAKVGEGLHTAREVLRAAYPQSQDNEAKAEFVPPARPRRRSKAAADAIPIKGLIPGMALHFAKCCYPLQGDRIVGIVTTGKGVTIHTIDCDTLASFADSPERWLDVAWNPSDEDAPAGQVGRLSVVLVNEPGSLSELATLIAKSEANITNLKITHRNVDFFQMLVDVEVRNRRQFSSMMAALRGSPAINSVERARS